MYSAGFELAMICCLKRKKKKECDLKKKKKETVTSPWFVRV